MKICSKKNSKIYQHTPTPNFKSLKQPRKVILKIPIDVGPRGKDQVVLASAANKYKVKIQQNGKHNSETKNPLQNMRNWLAKCEFVYCFMFCSYLITNGIE